MGPARSGEAETILHSHLGATQVRFRRIADLIVTIVKRPHHPDPVGIAGFRADRAPSRV